LINAAFNVVKQTPLIGNQIKSETKQELFKFVNRQIEEFIEIVNQD
jgi:hypothetical protein